VGGHNSVLGQARGNYCVYRCVPNDFPSPDTSSQEVRLPEREVDRSPTFDFINTSKVCISSVFISIAHIFSKHKGVNFIEVKGLGLSRIYAMISVRLYNTVLQDFTLKFIVTD
jgi:hypothetical protein